MPKTTIKQHDITDFGAACLANMKTFPFVFFLALHSLCAQELAVNHFKGIVLDTNSKNPIPFAHFTYDNSKGFTSNDKGTFYVTDLAESIAVKVSCIGYQTQYATLNANTPKTIFLSSAVETLDEIELVYVDEKKELLKKVIANIPKNYPNKKEIITGVIHEGVFVDSLFQDTIYNAEYNVTFNKLEYSKKRKTGNLVLEKGEATIYKMKDSVPAIFYGVLHSVHSNDIVMRRSAPLRLSKLDSYKLTIKDTLFYDNLTLIKVAFQTDDFHGNLFVDADSYAVAKGEYWSKGKTSAIERLRGFERKERYYSVHYDKYSDEKWRLKFIHFMGSYTQKRKGEVQTFYLKDNFIIRGFEPVSELIPHNTTMHFNTPGVLADNVISDFSSSNTDSETFQKKLKAYRFFSKFRFELAVDAYPINVQPYSLSFNFLENPVKNPAKNRKTHLALSSNYFYDVTKTLQIELNFTSSVSKNTLSVFALGASKKINLDAFGKFKLLVGTQIGYRRIFDNPFEHAFTGNLSINGKTFKKDKVNLYLGQKEYYLSPKAGLNFSLSNRLTFSLSAQYFYPFSSRPSVLIEDAKGLFKKSVSYRIESKNIVENKFSYGMGLVLNL